MRLYEKYYPTIRVKVEHKNTNNLKRVVKPSWLTVMILCWVKDLEQRLMVLIIRRTIKIKKSENFADFFGLTPPLLAFLLFTFDNGRD